ncbi:MAG: hypothetical protein ACLGJC_25030 [Alphaproteobacteria bacterium]
MPSSDTTQDTLIRNAERAIRAILLGLENEHDIRIDSVEVDSRQFADHAVTIWPKESSRG